MGSTRVRSLAVLLGATLVTAGGLSPATAADLPVGATATRWAGKAFDTCAAPSRATMKAWRSSSYGGIGIYVAGGNRACAQPQLTASWVRDVTAMGWRLLPISMGLQAPCRDNLRKKPMDAAKAALQGTADAATAVAAAGTLGLAPGSPLYADIESYDRRNTSCVATVARYLSAWTLELHRSGYLSGVYGNLGSGIADLSARYASPTDVRPDAVWLARWDRSTKLRGWAGIPDVHWPTHQRTKQYRGDHHETHGGVRLNIDSDIVDGPVATVARAAKVVTQGTLRTRQGPSTATPITGTRAPGEALSVLCRASGETINGSPWWDKLTNGSYVSDAYVGAKGVPGCRYPTQVAPAAGTVARSGPGAAFAAGPTLPVGALAWVVCRTAGLEVWNRLDDATFVSQTGVAPATAVPSPAVPAC